MDRHAARKGAARAGYAGRGTLAGKAVGGGCVVAGHEVVVEGALPAKGAVAALVPTNVRRLSSVDALVAFEVVLPVELLSAAGMVAFVHSHHGCGYDMGGGRNAKANAACNITMCSGKSIVGKRRRYLNAFARS